MQDWIINLVESTGYWGVGLLMLLETVFPPIPSEVIMTVAGVSAARGQMELGWVIAAGTSGAMIGNWLWFWLAIRFGEKRLHRLIDRHSRWLTLDWTEVERGERLFGRHGSAIVMFARMMPTLRSLISIPAGLFGMSHRRFLVFSTIGTAGWSAALAGVGYFLGLRFAEIDRWLGPLSTAIVVAIVVAWLWRVWRWRPGAG